MRFEASDRMPLKGQEMSRALGGGLVPGSLVLVAGEPGIGKSTLLLQTAADVAASGGRVAYVSGEETEPQISLRAGRLGISGNGLFVVSETNLEHIIHHLESLAPQMVVVDSIQTTYLPESDSAPGSVSQVRDSTVRLMRWAKDSRVPVLIAGHVTKDGSIAGPRVLEHIVDVVLYLEGEAFSAYRLLRCVKNRYGSTNEVGVFEMKSSGLAEIENPSRAFLAHRGEGNTGSVVVPTLEGNRPLLVEIQALTSPNNYGQPRRTATGLDFNRLLLITAVLAKRAGLRLGNQDIIVSVTGGLKVSEPGADLGMALAIASSARDAMINPELAAVGEIGLSGELRPVPQAERRVKEAARLGFTTCLVPKLGPKIAAPKNTRLITAGTLKEALAAGLEK